MRASRASSHWPLLSKGGMFCAGGGSVKRSSKASTLWVMLVVVMEMACLISFIELEMTDKLSGSWFGLRSVSSTAT